MQRDVSHLACNSIQVPGALGSQSATTGKKKPQQIEQGKILTGSCCQNQYKQF